MSKSLVKSKNIIQQSSIQNTPKIPPYPCKNETNAKSLAARERADRVGKSSQDMPMHANHCKNVHWPGLMSSRGWWDHGAATEHPPGWDGDGALFGWFTRRIG